MRINNPTLRANFVTHRTMGALICYAERMYAEYSHAAYNVCGAEMGVEMDPIHSLSALFHTLGFAYAEHIASIDRDYSYSFAWTALDYGAEGYEITRETCYQANAIAELNAHYTWALFDIMGEGLFAYLD